MSLSNNCTHHRWLAFSEIASLNFSFLAKVLRRDFVFKPNIVEDKYVPHASNSTPQMASGSLDQDMLETCCDWIFARWSRNNNHNQCRCLGFFQNRVSVLSVFYKSVETRFRCSKSTSSGLSDALVMFPGTAWESWIVNLKRFMNTLKILKTW